MARRGRKLIEIDRTQFEKLCQIQCTLDEIAGWFNCSTDTIERWCVREYREKFAGIYKIYSANGKISLRRNQFRMAENSVPMAIWLGKQYLGQRDGFEVSNDEAMRKLDEILRQQTEAAGKNADVQPETE